MCFLQFEALQRACRSIGDGGLGARSAKTFGAYNRRVAYISAHLVVGDAEVADLLGFGHCRFDVPFGAREKCVYPGGAREEIFVLEHVVDVFALFC